MLLEVLLLDVISVAILSLEVVEFVEVLLLSSVESVVVLLLDVVES